MGRLLRSKLTEVLSAVLPIVALVWLLHLTLAPMTADVLLLFHVGAFLLIVGMVAFMIGTDISMRPMGEMIGAQLTRSRRLTLFVVFGLLIGFLITVAEPDLQVLAKQVQGVPDAVIICAVAGGVGVFLVIALLRIIFRVNLKKLLLGCYLLVFLVAAFTNPAFLSVAFDSGGVTTGPITVPFILTLGVGVASVMGSRSSAEDSFGLVALCSVGPIIAVMILSALFGGTAGDYTPVLTPSANTIGGALHVFASELPVYAKEIALALLPIAGLFIAFQLIYLHLHKKQLIRIGVGLVYTFIGLTLFLTGVNVGFLPAGKALGAALASRASSFWVIPVGMVMGFCVVAAEPAVHVLNREVSHITGGSISRRAMMLSLSLGVAVSIGISMVRALTGISIWWFLAPGYGIALALMFVTPGSFTAIAFDSGGVASGAMTATFLLPFAMGASEAVGSDVMTSAFGLVAMVAMTPLIAIQLLGLVYRVKQNSAQLQPALLLPPSADEAENYIDLSHSQNVDEGES